LIDLSWIKDIHDIGSEYFPKEESLRITMVRDKSTYFIHYENTSDRKIEIQEIFINGIEINKFHNMNGMNIKTQFPLQKDQERTITLYSDKDNDPPEIITFVVKSRLGKRKELEYHL